MQADIGPLVFHVAMWLSLWVQMLSMERRLTLLIKEQGHVHE
jgi:hypothetical protein